MMSRCSSWGSAGVGEGHMRNAGDVSEGQRADAAVSSVSRTAQRQAARGFAAQYC